jgi:hypothetical protein
MDMQNFAAGSWQRLRAAHRALVLGNELGCSNKRNGKFKVMAIDT